MYGVVPEIALQFTVKVEPSFIDVADRVERFVRTFGFVAVIVKALSLIVPALSFTLTRNLYVPVAVGSKVHDVAVL